MFYKYQKYKKKYIEIKNQIGGDCVSAPNDNDNTLTNYDSFKDLKFKSSFTNMHNDKMCYCAKDAAEWIYTNGEFDANKTKFPYISIHDITLRSGYPISINQIWYIIVNNNNNFKELHNMIEQDNYQCNDHEITVRDSKTFLYTQNQKEYIENWLRLLKKYDMFIYSLNDIKEWLKNQIFTNEDALQNIIRDAKLLNIILDEARERIYYSENQLEYYNMLVKYNKAFHDYNALPANYKQPDRTDLDITDEIPMPLSMLNYVNNNRTSNNIKSEINARIYSSIKEVRKDTAEFNFNSFGFTRKPLLKRYAATYDEQMAQDEILKNFWSVIPMTNHQEFNMVDYYSKKLLDLVDPIDKRFAYIKSILEYDNHPDEYLRTYEDDIIFQDLEDKQKTNRTIFITHMKSHFTSLVLRQLVPKSFEVFITGLYYELLYFKCWADKNNIKYNLLTWRLHLYKIAKQNNCLEESVKYIRNILSYRLGSINQVIGLDNFYDVLFLIFIFGYFPYDPLIQFKDVWGEIEYDNSTSLELSDDILRNNNMETLPQSNITVPNYLTYDSQNLKTYLNDTLDSTIVSPEKYIDLISGLYFVILEISDIIFNYNKYNHNILYCTSNDDNKLIMQTHKSNAEENPIRQLDTSYLDLLKTILKIVLNYTELTTVNKKSIEDLHKVVTSIIKNINLFRYESAKEYLISRKDELSDKLVDTFGLYKTTNKHIFSEIVIEIFNYLKNTIDIKKI